MILSTSSPLVRNAVMMNPPMQSIFVDEIETNLESESADVEEIIEWAFAKHLNDV